MLVVSLCQCVVSFLVLRLQSEPSIGDRALWLHRSCRMVLRRLGFRLCVGGVLPTNGLIASNHLSYLDILFFGATVPCVFVAKREVRGWPLLGLLAALGGTVFVDRTSAGSAAEAASRIETFLKAGVLVLVFPEGTSSDGSGVLRFYASLFEPAVRVGSPVTAAAIGYSAGCATEKDLCYYGDISFGPHLLESFRLFGINAIIRFSSSATVFASRKAAAQEAHREVVDLRERLWGGWSDDSTDG